MITDLRTLDDDHAFDADVCIVGSGAAGLAIAMELLTSNLRVVVLEGGGEQAEPDSQALYELDAASSTYAGAMLGRFRRFGGATTQWGGQALPLTPLDFEVRPWIENSGWPISFEALAPYYARAKQFLRVDAMNYDTDLFELFGVTPPRVNTAEVVHHYSKWSPSPDLNRLYRAAIAQATNVTLVLHANADAITLSDDGRVVTSVSARTLEGKRARVNAREFVLCAGGLETPRLLLANDRQQQAGIGNSHDLVGRYYQDHASAIAGVITPRDPDGFQRVFNLRNRNGVKYSVRWSAAEQLQRRERMVNVSGGFVFIPPDESGMGSLKEVYRRLRRRQLGPDLLALAVDSAASLPRLLGPVATYVFAGRTYTPGATVQLTLMTEQAPRADSRVRLGQSRDALGMRRIHLDWSVDDLTVRTMRRFAGVAQRNMSASGLGAIAFSEWVTNEGIAPELSDNYHHMGATRMAVSATEGVVDPECRVHGIPNLSIGGSAVFPTGGHSNPTLTLIALCIRIADRLRQAGR